MQVARESPKPPSEHEQLSNALRTRSHLFATGDADIQRTALAAAKSLFDSGGFFIVHLYIIRRKIS